MNETNETNPAGESLAPGINGGAPGRAAAWLARAAAGRKLYAALFAALFACAALPLFGTGVTVNDDLQMRMASMKGFGALLRKMWAGAANQGRPLAALPWALSEYVCYFKPQAGYIGLVKAAGTAANAGLFGLFLSRVFESRRFAAFTAAMLLAALPITFEHTLPNAFINFFLINILLFASLLRFIDFLRGGGRRSLAASCALWFVLLCCYEAFLAYAPVFFFLALRFLPEGEKTFKNAAPKVKWPALTACAYLALYVGLRKVFPSNYGGNRLSLVSPGASLKIIGQLAASSLPGYFWANPKYIYVFTRYGEFSIFSFTPSGVFRALAANLAAASPRLVLMTGALFALLCSLLKAGLPPAGGGKTRNSALAAACCLVLPAFPVAAAEHYQGIVNASDYIALPVSYLMQFAAVFLLSLLCWNLLIREKSRRFLIGLSAALALLTVPISRMSEVFAARQAQNFKRLTVIENLFGTRAASELLSGGGGNAHRGLRA